MLGILQNTIKRYKTGIYEGYGCVKIVIDNMNLSYINDIAWQIQIIVILSSCEQK